MRPWRLSRQVTRLLVLALAVGLVAPAATLAKEPPVFPRIGTDELAKDSWIVTLEAGVDATDVAKSMARRAGGKAGLVYEHAINGFQLKGSAKAAEALAGNPRVLSVTADRPVFLTETLPIGVERIDAWTFTNDGAYQAGYRGNGARIAILDTGIDLDHPDLANSIDNASSLNCLNQSATPNDGHGHGTHVAGIAAAPLNNTGVVGVAPEATLVAIKMFDDAGNSSEALALCALDHVVDLSTDADPANDIDVANMSWGEHRAFGSCTTDALRGAICTARDAGVTLVAGAGNDARLADDFVPAAFYEVISVSAIADFDAKPGGLAGCAFVASLSWIECDDTYAFFSNWGWTIEVAAPGVNVYSTWKDGGYKVLDGTSMATPHVSGVVALMAAANPAMTPVQIRSALMMSGECPNGQWADADGTAGCGSQGQWPDDQDGLAEALVNAKRAAVAAAGTTPPPPPPQPTAPSSPTLLSATGASASISLQWTTPADGGSAITGYEVWRGTSSGGEAKLTTVGVQQTFVDSGVADGTTYWYQVAALNSIGVSSLSNELSATLAKPPDAPTLLGAPADRSAILSWTVPTNTGGAPITGYKLYRAIGTGAESLLATTGSSETNYVDFAVSNGTPYTYRVAAINAAGEGAKSDAVTVTPTPTVTAPGAPESLVATKAKTTSAINLAWSAPTSDGGSPIATYLVYRRLNATSSLTLIGWTNATTLTFTDITTAKKTSYTYAVKAFNSYYESAYSNLVTIRTR